MLRSTSTSIRFQAWRKFESSLESPKSSLLLIRNLRQILLGLNRGNFDGAITPTKRIRQRHEQHTAGVEGAAPQNPAASPGPAEAEFCTTAETRQSPPSVDSSARGDSSRSAVRGYASTAGGVPRARKANARRRSGLGRRQLAHKSQTLGNAAGTLFIIIAVGTSAETTLLYRKFAKASRCRSPVGAGDAGYGAVNLGFTAPGEPCCNRRYNLA